MISINLLVLINSIVVALMAIYMYVIVNERRLQEDRTVQKVDGEENLTAEIRRISDELKEVQYIDNVVKKLAVGITDEIKQVSDERIADRVQSIDNFVKNMNASITAEIRRISEKVKNIENVVEKLKVSMTAEIPRICEERIAEKEPRRTDDRALSMCIGIADKNTYIKSVRRTVCDGGATCESICKEIKVLDISLKCFNALRLYGRSEKIHLQWRICLEKEGCSTTACGPNYCCCSR
ncbi:unnamed protein product [Mytilus edulis]|uniref:Uncharacterized protein n=2 Tax=Mytilus TaxID=6548 RepID=A0A8S3UQI5_MYTED|nr:unnamed protein product [Mytilus edulis]